MLLFLAPWGRKELLLSFLLWAATGAGLFLIHPAAVALPAILLLWTLWFFRDPERPIPGDPGLLVSPADGTVTEVSSLPRVEWIEEPALRIGIFLSIFNVHVNRSPCDGVVKATRYAPGKFLDARDPRSGELNESNAILLERADGPIVVRQVAGKIARRIVCAVRENDRLERGQRIGMIKFGSRTELWVPAGAGCACRVKGGESVRGGATVLGVVEGP